MLEQRAKLGGHASLTEPGTITGSVAGFDGQPVAGACVTAVGAGRSVMTMAAGDGAFRLAGLTAGSYALEYRDCSPAGRNLTSATGYLTTWSGGAATQNSAARVQVTAGQVKRVAAVMLRPANPAAAIAAGQASFRRELAANSRSISATAAAKTGQVTGKVTGKGKPLGGICVEVTSVRNGLAYGAKTVKNGTYTVRGVKAGRYYVTFAAIFGCANGANWLQQAYKHDRSPAAPYNNKATAVKVSAGHKTAGINGNLRLGAQISGTVTGNRRTKLRGIGVTATAATGQGAYIGVGVCTNAKGKYQLHALFPGKYRLQFRIGCNSGSENYAPATHPGVKVSFGQRVTLNEAMKTGASITGKVTLSSVSGKPLKGLCVYAQTAKGGFGADAATNSSGHYRLIGLTGGTFLVEVSPGCSNNGNYTSAALTAHTTAGKQTSNVNVVLQRGAVIRGTIKDTGGNPVSGICIEVASSNPNASSGLFIGVGGIDGNGSYFVNQLPAGTYQVGFYTGCGKSGNYAPNWYDNQPSETTASPIRLATGQVFGNANAVLQPAATITGKVTNTAGKALSGVCVDATMPSGAGLVTVANAAITRNGTYRISGLAPGQYLINFGCGYGGRYANQWFPGAPDAATAELVSAPAGQTTWINAVLKPAGTVSGVVTGKSGHPLSGVCVSAVDTAGAHSAASGGNLGVIVNFGGSGGPEEPAVTGKGGTYKISGLAAGRYHVSFSPCLGAFGYAEQWYRDKVSAQAATAVAVRAGKVTAGIDSHLVLGGTISGRVLNAARQPLRNICVEAAAGADGPFGVAVTGKAGTYTMHGLASGRYTVEFVPCGSQNLIAAAAHARVTAPHATTGVNATMHPGGSIAGTVTANEPSGPQPVSGACVEVYRKNAAEPVGNLGLTGIDGSYRATGLASGTYQVYFGDPQCFSGTPGLVPQWFNGQATQAGAGTVTVKVGTTTKSINAALQPDGQITGTVSTGSPTTPLSGVCVTAFPVSGNGSPTVVAVSRATGDYEYTLADLLPGLYKVRFSAGCGATGYATQWWDHVSSKAHATAVPVVAGQTASGISATLTKSS